MHVEFTLKLIHSEAENPHLKKNLIETNVPEIFYKMYNLWKKEIGIW